MVGMGHNNGPTMEAGESWRAHCWTKARADLLPTLPLEIVRMRVKRAQEIGMQYRAYATVRAITGRDIVGFLFSSNALDMRRAPVPPSDQKARKLRGIQHCGRMLATHRPVTPEAAKAVLEASGVAIDAAFAAPAFTDAWPVMRDQMRDMFRDAGVHPASILMVGETAFEREWSDAGRMAGYLAATEYFAS